MVPQESIDLVKKYEGCRLKAYQDETGIWTCGWGSTGPDITAGTIWTQEQADSRMIQDLLTHYVGASVLCPMLNALPLVAVGDFTYNLGLTRLKASTLRKKILKGDMIGASNEFKKWVRAGGRVLPGLVARRLEEKKLFMSVA